MSDLAAMLSDLHDDPAGLPHRQQPGPAPDPVRTKLPEWASEEALDAAFANWVPGPQMEASPAEHSLFSDLTELAQPADGSDPATADPAAGWTQLAETAPAPSIDAPLSVDVPLTGDETDPVEAAAAHAVALGRALAAEAPVAPPAVPAVPTPAVAPPPASYAGFGPRSAPASRETTLAELLKGSSARVDDDVLPGQTRKRRWFSWR